VLLSLSHKFLFIANVKTASSAIEAALRPHAEIAIMKTQFGKHDPLTVVSGKFPWVRKFVPYEEFFVFGVMREPVDWLLSLYNSHTKPGFDGKQHSTKDVPFSRFLTHDFEKRWQLRPQNLRFTDENGRFRVDRIVNYSALDAEFPLICERIGLVGIKLNQRNVSPQVLSRDDLTKADLEFIREKYAADYELIANRPRSYCGRRATHSRLAATDGRSRFGTCTLTQ
jgi:hypothetical protein